MVAGEHLSFYTMKAAVLILATLFLVSCSAEDAAPTVKCGEIISKGWNPQAGDYIRIKGYEDEVIPVKVSYELGQIYCY